MRARTWVALRLISLAERVDSTWGFRHTGLGFVFIDGEGMRVVTRGGCPIWYRAHQYDKAYDCPTCGGPCTDEQEGGQPK